MEDFIKSIKAFLYDRTSSPLFGALVITWLTSNYKAVLISISGTDIEKKLDLLSAYFNEVYCQWAFNHSYVQFTWDIPNWIARGIGYPVVATITYIFVYPFFAERVYKFSLDSQKRLRSLKKQSDELRILDEKESREILEQVNLAEAKYNTDLTRLNQENAQLKNIIQSLELTRTNNADLINELEKLKVENENLNKKIKIQPGVYGSNAAFAESFNNAKNSLAALDPDLTEDELKQLKKFAHTDDSVSAEVVFNQSPFIRLKAKELCASLVKKDFLKETNAGVINFYELTPKGIKKLLSLDEFKIEKNGRDPTTGY